MRLSQKHIEDLIQVLSDEIKLRPAELFLYGSRADDSLKGGDIDLLLVLHEEVFASLLIQRKFHILNQFKKKIGDRKIDFSILTSQQANQDPFYQEALKKSILLKTWNNSQELVAAPK